MDTGIRLSVITLELKKEGIEDYYLVVLPIIVELYRVHSLINTGYSSYTFIDTAYIRAYKLPLFALEKPRPLRGFKGQVETYVTYYTRVTMNLNRHVDSDMFFYLI